MRLPIPLTLKLRQAPFLKDWDYAMALARANGLPVWIQSQGSSRALSLYSPAGACVTARTMHPSFMAGGRS